MRKLLKAVKIIFQLSIAFLLAATAASAQSSDEYLRHALQLIKSYQWQEAVSVLRKGLQTYPDNPAMAVQLGNLLVRTGQTVEGAALLRKALQTDAENPEVLKSLAEAEIHLGRFSSAVNLLKNSLRYNPGDAESFHRIAISSFLAEDHNQAVQCSSRAVELDPLNPAYRKFYSILLDQEGRYDESYHQLRAAQKLLPRDPTLLLSLGEKKRKDGRWSQALEYFQRASELDPENPLYHQELSRAYTQLGQRQLAAAESARATEMAHAFEQYAQAVILHSRGRTSAAVGILEPVVTRNPEFSTGIMFLAFLFRSRGEESRALDLYLKVIDRNPLATTAIEEGAWIQLRQGFPGAAIELLRKLNSDSPNLALTEGFRAMIEGDWEKALENFRKVEAVLPLNPELLQLMAFCLKARGEWKEAMACLDKALRLQPRNTGIETQLKGTRSEAAFQLLKEQKWREALAAFRELISQDIDADYFLNSAYCHQQLSEWSQAISYYRTGLRGNPAAVWARMNLALVLYRLSRYQEAASEWEACLKSLHGSGGAAPIDSTEAYYNLGLCYSRLELFQKAQGAFQKAIQTGKETPELLYQLGVVRLRLQSPEEALILIRRSAQAGYDPAKRLLLRAPR